MSDQFQPSSPALSNHSPPGCASSVTPPDEVPFIVVALYLFFTKPHTLIASPLATDAIFSPTLTILVADLWALVTSGFADSWWTVNEPSADEVVTAGLRRIERVEVVVKVVEVKVAMVEGGVSKGEILRILRAAERLSLDVLNDEL